MNVSTVTDFASIEISDIFHYSCYSYQYHFFEIRSPVFFKPATIWLFNA